MKRVIADFTNMRAGTRIDTVSQIEKCQKCGRKGAAQRRIGPMGTVTLEVTHTVGSGIFGFASVDRCVSVVEPAASAQGVH